ncbi:hypothetical protein N665_0224s0025 [Sinapis alba]|nr:hypothetical protein N665_0224s0025 [Sinapis alba]
MNNLTIFMLVIVMCFSLKESSGCNLVEFKNELQPPRIFKLNCTSNRKETISVQEIKPNGVFNFPVKEKGKKRIVWQCHLRDGKHFIDIWRTYRGAARARCDQIRAYIVKSEAVHLVRNKQPTKQSFVWQLARF